MQKDIWNTLYIDVSKGTCVLNGVDISKDTSELHLDFKDGKWSLVATKTSGFVERFNRKTTHFLWIVFVSMITAIVTTMLYKW